LRTSSSGASAVMSIVYVMPVEVVGVPPKSPSADDQVGHRDVPIGRPPQDVVEQASRGGEVEEMTAGEQLRVELHAPGAMVREDQTVERGAGRRRIGQAKLGLVHR
jgi:hypothetical protein